MKVAIMQPYFFPYLGYYQLIQTVDKFILFDDVQYIRHGWINRNRILKPGGGWQYVIAPLAPHSQKTLIRDIRLKNGSEEWKELIMRQMAHYKKKAPFYDQTIDVLKQCFTFRESNVTLFNRASMLTVCEYLDIDANIQVSSELNLNYDNVSDAGEWALRICEQAGAREYINPSGGKELFDPAKFSRSGILLSFLSSNLSEYSQKRNPPFEAGLSMLDIMMFNSPDDIRRMLADYRIEHANKPGWKDSLPTSLPFYKTLLFTPELMELLFAPELLEFAYI